MAPSEFLRPALRVAFVGGGSGGHLFPAVAIAQELLTRNPECRFLFLTSQRAVDRKVLEASGLPPTQTQVTPYVHLSSHRGLMGSLAQWPLLCRSFWQARRTLRLFQPHVVVGLGALASVPGVVAADRMAIPVVLLEQNCLPGKATRRLACRARITVFGLPVPDDRTHHWPSPVRTCGTPVRQEIRDLAAMAIRDESDRRRILILGGSQGSHSVNQIVADALCGGIPVPPDWEIVHQTGEADLASIRERYQRQSLPVRVESFLTDIGRELASAAAVVCRSGAVTLQELACAGVPVILIPLSTAAESHQLLNARLLEESGAAIVIDEQHANARISCRKAIEDLVSDAMLRSRMAENIRRLAMPHAAETITQLLHNIAQGLKL